MTTLPILASFVRILAATFLGLLILSVTAFHGLRWYGGQRLAAEQQRFSQHHGALDPSSYLRPAVSNTLNAAFWFVKGAEGLTWVDADRHHIAFAVTQPLDEWPPETAAAVAAAAVRNHDPLAAYAYASTLTHSNFAIDYSLGEGASTPAVLSLMSGARLVTALARRSDSVHEISGHLRTLKVLAQALQSETDINTQYAGWAIESMLLALIAEDLANGERRYEYGYREALITVDSVASFESYLSWQVASRHALTKAEEQSTYTNPLAYFDPVTRDRMLQVMIHDFRKALQLEKLHAEYALHSRLPCNQTNTRETSFEDSTFPDLDRFKKWLEAILISRSLVATALDLNTGESPARRSGSATTELGNRIAWHFDDLGNLIIEAEHADSLRAALTARRYNPAPPLTLVVQSLRRPI